MQQKIPMGAPAPVEWLWDEQEMRGWSGQVNFFSPAGYYYDIAQHSFPTIA
jgi:hypothetical protein